MGWAKSADLAIYASMRLSRVPIAADILCAAKQRSKGKVCKTSNTEEQRQQRI
jgi:hypothetical protein